MATQNRGTVAVIGSVAGDRGRKSNYVYGAAKGLVDRYLQGLRHRFAGSGVKIAVIKPGPTDTPMTAHLKGSTKLASVEAVARDIVDALARGKEVVYVPGKWRVIMLIIRHLPGFVFNKMNI
jgi:short-subunit dehydrogenase